MSVFQIYFEVRNQYLLGEKIEVTFHMKNTSVNTIKVLKWSTPFEEYFGANIKIADKDNKIIPYEGNREKRANPEESDFIKISPNSEVSVVINLASVFYLSLPGTYKVSYDGALTYYIQGQSEKKMELAATSPTPFILKRGANPLSTDGHMARKAYDAKMSLRGVQAFSAPQNVTGCPLAPIFENTRDNSIKNTILESHNILFNYLKHCIKGFSTVQRTNDNHFNMAFGTKDDTSYKKVKAIIENIYDYMTKTQITYVYDVSNANKRTFARVKYAFPNKIFLCNCFFSAKMTGEDSKIGTIFHELSHLYARTKDHKYGRTDILQLAKQDSAKAIANADNFEFFLESTFLNWEGDGKVKDIYNKNLYSEFNPGLASYNGALYAVIKGSKGDDKMYYASYSDTNNWTDLQIVKTDDGRIAKTTVPPKLGVFKSELHTLVKGWDNNFLYPVYFNQFEWEIKNPLQNRSSSNVTVSSNPNLVQYKNKLYCVYKPKDSTELSVVEYDGDSWGEARKIKEVSSINPGSTHQPGLAVLNNKLYVIYKSSLADDMWFATFDGTTWSDNTCIKTVADIQPKAFDDVCATTINDVVYIPYRDGLGSIGLMTLYYDNNLKKEIWCDNEFVTKSSEINPRSADFCNMVNYNNTNYMFYKGAVSDDYYYIKQPMK